MERFIGNFLPIRDVRFSFDRDIKVLTRFIAKKNRIRSAGSFRRSAGRFSALSGFWGSVTTDPGSAGRCVHQENIRKELYLDQPGWKQFFLSKRYLPGKYLSRPGNTRQKMKGVIHRESNQMRYKNSLAASFLPEQKRGMGSAYRSFAGNAYPGFGGHAYRLCPGDFSWNPCRDV